MIVEDVNLMRGIFLVGKMSTFLAVGWDSSPFSRFPRKIEKDNGA